MNNDLISREALKMAIKYNQMYVNQKLAVDDVIKLIDNVPTVEAEWLLTPDKFTPFKCSICNQPNFWEDNFCCNCGAKMKGGANNGKQ